MIRHASPEQTQLEMVTLDSLVPADHLLRKIEAAVDFSFIHPLVAPLYCADNGRPALDPTLLFKALFIGYLFGVRSERQLVREIEVNVAYRWFLRLKLTEKVFDASTLSQNRRRRFNGTDVAQSIFDGIVEQAIKAGLVDGTVLYTDSTHLKANANKGKFTLQAIAKSRSDYWDALDAAINEDREEHGRAPMKDKPREPAIKETKVSTTDRDAGYMVREGKPKGFFYLDHRTVDGKLGIITDTFATPANVHDSIVYLSRLDRQTQRFQLDVGAVGLDAGYATAGIAKGLEERGILGVTGYRRPTPPKDGMMARKAFIYEEGADGYRCPQGQLLGYATTDRTGYRHYKSDPAICKKMPAARIVHLECRRDAHDHATRLAGRTRQGRQLSPDALGQARLQAPQGNGRALLRRRQAAARPPLRPLSGARTCCRPVPARRRRPEYEENRPRYGPVHRSQARLSRWQPSRP